MFTFSVIPSGQSTRRPGTEIHRAPVSCRKITATGVALVFFITTIFPLDIGANPTGTEANASRQYIQGPDEEHVKWRNAWQLESAHFKLRSNAPYAEISRILANLELFYGYFYAQIGDALGIERQFDLSVYYFKDKQAFALQEILCGTGMMDQFGFMARCRAYGSNREELIVYSYKSAAEPVPEFNLFHEVVHQILARHYGEEAPDYFDWLDEGLAIYLEYTPYDQRLRHRLFEIDAGAVTRAPYIAAIRRSDHIRFENFFELLELPEMAGGGVVAWTEQAAGLVDFFLNAANGEYRRNFLHYVDLVYKNLATPETFRQIFKRAPDSFRPEWLDYIKSLPAPD